MGTPAMGLHARERRRLRRIEEGLREDAPDLEVLLAGRPPLHRPAPRAPAVGLLTGYMVAPALILAGLALQVTWLVVAGAVACPFVPVIAWLLIRRHVIRGWPRRGREP